MIQVNPNPHSSATSTFETRPGKSIINVDVAEMGNRIITNDFRAFHVVDTSLTVCTMGLLGIISKSWRGPDL